MEPRLVLEPSVMIEQVESLPKLIEEQVTKFNSSVQKFIKELPVGKVANVYLIGCGDSYHAALAVEMAFENIAKVNCESINGLRFLEYTSNHLLPDSIVIGVSASGGSARIVEAIKRVNENGGLTVGLTGNPESPLAKNADLVINVDIPFMGHSPGVRTYEASVLGLLITAIRLGQSQGHLEQKEADGLVDELRSISAVVSRANKACKALSMEAARHFKDSPAIIFLGSGPNFGTAQFSAAKICEACGVISFGQDLEEFAHVENLCYPDNMPIVIFAAKGNSHWRAIEIANLSKSLGKRVMVVGDGELLNNGFDFIISLPDTVREEFSPLYFHVISDYLAGYLTEELGRKLFRSDKPRENHAAHSNIQVNRNQD